MGKEGTNECICTAPPEPDCPSVPSKCSAHSRYLINACGRLAPESVHNSSRPHRECSSIHFYSSQGFPEIHGAGTFTPMRGKSLAHTGYRGYSDRSSTEWQSQSPFHYTLSKSRYHVALAFILGVSLPGEGQHPFENLSPKTCPDTSIKCNFLRFQAPGASCGHAP